MRLRLAPLLINPYYLPTVRSNLFSIPLRVSAASAASAQTRSLMAYLLNRSTVVAVIGAGSMGAGIAQLAAQSGHTVRLHDAQAGAAAAALERIAADLDGAVKRGKLQPDERSAVLARITPADTLDALGGCGLVVEAIVERLDVKQGLFRALEKVLRPTRCWPPTPRRSRSPPWRRACNIRSG